MKAQEDYTNDPLFASLSEFVKEKGYKTDMLCGRSVLQFPASRMTPAGATEIMEIIARKKL